MKFLVIGATGMAGHTIAMFLHEKGHDITAFSRREFPYCKNVLGDAFDRELIKKVINQNNFDIVVNCIGVLNKHCDQNPSNAIFLNSFLPHFIADVTSHMNTRIIHMSTDCVFSGKSAPYYEKSSHDGEFLYEKTKALGEINDTKNLTFRNSIIGPDMNEDGIGLFNWFISQRDTLYGYEKAIWSGVTTLTLAKAIEKAAEHELTGLYHLVNNTSISKYELLNLFNNYFKDNELIIKPDCNVNINKTLVNTRKDFSFIVPDYENMIIEMKEWVMNHQNIYKHYFAKCGK